MAAARKAVGDTAELYVDANDGYAADHARADRFLFDGIVDPIGGVLRADLSRAGCGLEIKRSDAEDYRIQ